MLPVFTFGALALASWATLQDAPADRPVLQAGAASTHGEIVDSDHRARTDAIDANFTDAHVIAKRFELAVAKSGRHSVELRSYLFDAYLVLRDGEGGVLGEDDDALLGTHARVTADLDGAKRYLIEACALHGSRGSFEIRVIEGDPPALSLLERHAADVADAKRAVEVREAARGPDHADTAHALNQLGLLLRTEGDFAGARALFERALAIWEKTLGPDHPGTASGLANLALVLKQQGDLESARPLYERALAIREQTLGPEHADTAQSLDQLGSLLGTQGEYAAALELTERALAIREKVLGPQHPRTAIGLNNLASLYWSQGNLAAARPLFERALAIHEALYGSEHPSTAQSRNNLAVLLESQGNFAAARPLHEAALAIRERTIGPEHPDTAASLNNLALLCKAQGDHAAARRYFERAIPILERTLGPDHELTGKGLSNLAWLLHAQGDFVAARPLSERAIAISERALGPEHPDTARSVNNHALLLQAQGDSIAARALFERALAIWEKSLGPDAPNLAIVLNNLAWLEWEQGDLATARSLSERALAIRERTLGPDHPDTAANVSTLALLSKDLGELAAARALFERTLAILEKLVGPDHPDTVTSVANLALLALDEGDTARAAELARRSWRSSRASRSALVATLNERECYAYLAKVRSELEMLLCADTGSASLAAEAMLDWKGQTGRMISASRAASLETHAAELDELRAVQSQLSTLAFARDVASDEAHSRQLAELYRERERLERRVRDVLDTELSKPPTLAELRRSLDERAAFVDFFVHRAYEPGRRTSASDPTFMPGRWTGRRRVSAWITRPDHESSVHVDLGDEAELDAAIMAFLHDLVARRGVSVSTSGSSSDAAHDLRRRLWDPIAEHLEGVTRVFVSPDGALCTLPFETLTRDDGSFLIEHVAFVYEQTPDILAQPRQPSAERSRLLSVGGIDYAKSAPPGKDSVAAPATGAQSAPLATALASNAAASFDVRGSFESFWAPLGHTRYESDVVDALHARAFQEGARLALRGDAASEEALKRELPRHTVVHVATHGFFNPEGVPSLWTAAVEEAGKGRPGLRSESLELVGQAPGLLSGLVCAGANELSGADRDDGYLTAEEVGWLDLSAVELVVLSACETALGRSQSGEGLLGLRRAFELAGARTVVSSLWSVKDESTARLMQSFYENLWVKRMDRADALRAAQLSMLARNRAEHRDPLPSTWGAFVLSGEWR